MPDLTFPIRLTEVVAFSLEALAPITDREFWVQKNALLQPATDQRAIAIVVIASKRNDRDLIIGVGLAIVMASSMAGWIYALGWVAWNIVMWVLF